MIVTLKNNTLSATITTLGAELVTLKKEETNYIWTIDENYWNKTSPVLFPIVGKLKNDTYTFQNKEFTLPRHGFARNYNFEINHQTENEVVFSLKENNDTLKIYPFSFELQIHYTLSTSGLKISYSIQNNNDEIMPFSIGAHPAFAIHGDFNNHSLIFSNETEAFESHLLENELFSGETIPIPSKNGIIALNYSLFEKDALVFRNLKSEELTIAYKDNPILKVNFRGFPDLGIWTKVNAPFLCIEPWYGHADESSTNGQLEDKKGIQRINPKEHFKCYFSIDIL
ncbi:MULTISPECIES: aldose 1-epimerase family protein [Flavobacterium]|uniref:Aldose 1-epimerase family protein n=1 Tax=Flavobacterium jumunjinense TaxID=998845 RepID=A0ABV5GHZ0_9FLAO|nr:MULTISPECIES: aldose 1-epimerase family protein [Flavobacterium]